jgi:hypothetical protein
VREGEDAAKPFPPTKENVRNDDIVGALRFREPETSSAPMETTRVAGLHAIYRCRSKMAKHLTTKRFAVSASPSLPHRNMMPAAMLDGIACGTQSNACSTSEHRHHIGMEQREGGALPRYRLSRERRCRGGRASNELGFFIGHRFSLSQLTDSR